MRDVTIVIPSPHCRINADIHDLRCTVLSGRSAVNGVRALPASTLRHGLGDAARRTPDPDDGRAPDGTGPRTPDDFRT